MAESRRYAPFRLLGSRLKLLREDRHETVAEVSGAVEIDTEQLECIERGEERPSEDVLMLLINHFALPEREAVQLWETAGYDAPDDDKPRSPDSQSKNMVVLLAVDSRVLYSDQLEVATGPNGVILNFLQAGLQGQPLPVGRIGMSYTQAEAVLHTLQQALLRQRYMTGRRLLPPGSPTDASQA
ncbi:MAG TPA: helix-turn-helix transcriptional regulator [Candidatus Saccharimonadales bacterium]|nr:helix-turn-helix transcriptional regulator [Candidatus Saccharimonadales bacterium]